ncbi:MAG: ethylbenzene dehydrogenase-related protein [Planctomycetales bacterium]
MVLEARKEGAAVPSAATNVGGAAKDATQQTVVAASPASGLPPIPSMFSSDAERAQAKALYSRNCAACHGPDGGGDGIAAGFMFPKPRNFHRGLFRLVTTSNSVPTVEDLERMLARGMPGSAMPPWPNLSEAERLLLARQVIEFRREGVRAQEIADAEAGGFELDVADMRQLAEHLTTPGAAIDFPPIPAATAELIRQGGLLYQSAGCVGCHGETGKGDGLERMVDAEGFPTSPRDLTGGIFKGSTDPRSIYIRTQAGMPGAPMPATRTLSHEEISAVVHYVLSLSDETQRQAAVLNSERVVAARRASLPSLPLDSAWETVAPARVRLTPLWWRNEFAPHLDVQAVHDGRSIALRLTWDDATNDRIAMRTEAFADAVAVELHSGQSPPFLGMGDAENLVDVWFWNADREEGPRSIEAIYPDTVVDQYPFSEGLVAGPEFVRAATRIENQPDLSLPARASGNPIVPATRGQGGSTLAAGGLGSLTFRIPRNQAVTAHGEWREERWSVSMTRPLAVSSAGGVPLEPGGEASVAFAVWDGSQRDRNGQKSFTIWQMLELKP